MYEFSEENLEALKALSKLEGIIMANSIIGKEEADEATKIILDYLLSTGKKELLND